MKGRSLHLTTVQEGDSQKILIITKEKDSYVRMLQTKLSSYDNDVIILDDIPQKLTPYLACFFINVSERTFREVISKHQTRNTFVFLNQHKTAEKCLELVANYTGSSIKIADIQTSLEFFEKDLEALFWFSFAKNSEKMLTISHHQLENPKHPAPVKHTVSHHYRRPKSIYDVLNEIIHPQYSIPIILLIFIFFHALFTPVLALSSYLHYQAALQLKERNIEQSETTLGNARTLLGISSVLYSWVRPTFSLFSLAILPDDLFLANQAAGKIVENGVYIAKRNQELRDLYYRTDKTTSETEYTSQLTANIIQRIGEINESMAVLKQKVPGWSPQLKQFKIQLHEYNQYVSSLQPFFPFIDWLGGKEEERKYLVLFANNMELRPGGGFIGSFAIITMRNLAIADFKVYDVYDADGQLTIHVQPPDPIRDHLEQPNWFLRDSAFSPDFTENAQQAQFFLKESLNITDFDGVVLITTTAIQHFLAALDELYIPDYKETVTSENFYIKAQLYAEKNFFPGSSQKKSFLGAVMNQMILAAYEANPLELFKAAKKSLDEKQIVTYFSNRDLQKLIDNNYWSGRTITLNCNISQNQNCLVDYIFPIDANVGVNKANFYISKNQKLNVKISEEGTIQNTLRVSYKNNSFKDVYPGGTYKNYFQLLLPRDITITRLFSNGEEVEDYTVDSEMYTTIGFLSEILPQESGEIEIHYRLNRKIQKGSGIYQLILQKQIGSPNSDFAITIELPKNLYVVNKNFSPVVKNNTINYNTTLSADKIFFIEFFTE